MIFNLSTELGRAQFKAYCNRLYRDGGLVELTKKMGIRTIKQNSYLHLILSFFALQYGDRMEFVKREFFKKHVNPDMFILEKEDRILGNVKYLRSSADLTTKEMTDCIERFRDWSAQEAGIYLPAPDEDAMIGEMYAEVERNKKYL